MANNNIYYGNLAVNGITGGAGAGSTVLDIQGTAGQLFSVVDGLTGSLMSVNDVSGLPILEVFSDDRVVMGTYGATGLIVAGTSVTTGDLQITGSATGAVTTLIDAGGVSLDFSQGNFFTLTPATGSLLLITPVNIQPGQTANLRITQPTPPATVNFSGEFEFAGGIRYAASATGGAVDILSMVTFDSSSIYVSFLKNMS
jgi:hypothetical protein